MLCIESKFLWFETKSGISMENHFMNKTGLSAWLLYFKYNKKKAWKIDVEMSVLDGEFSVEEFWWCYIFFPQWSYISYSCWSNQHFISHVVSSNVWPQCIWKQYLLSSCYERKMVRKYVCLIQSFHVCVCLARFLRTLPPSGPFASNSFFQK